MDLYFGGWVSSIEMLVSNILKCSKLERELYGGAYSKFIGNVPWLWLTYLLWILEVRETVWIVLLLADFLFPVFYLLYVGS